MAQSFAKRTATNDMEKQAADIKEKQAELSSSFKALIGCRGFHVYRTTTWKRPNLTDQLSLKPEPDNNEDQHVVAVIKGDTQVVVGHLPREISRRLDTYTIARHEALPEPDSFKGSGVGVRSNVLY
jgi:hypothetical protein